MATQDCEHTEIYWYDKDGIGMNVAGADHGRCQKCWAVIPGGERISLHAIYCDCERCLEFRAVKDGE